MGMSFFPNLPIAGMNQEEIFTFFDDSIALIGSRTLLTYWSERPVGPLPPAICQEFVNKRYELLEEVRRGAVGYYDFTSRLEDVAIDLTYRMLETATKNRIEK
jgi:hypothetical protein